MSVKIFTMTHKRFEVRTDKMYIPLQVGKATSIDLGYLGDDTGENISALNCFYSELTGIYWIWKNYKTSSYVGVCHYRRYLINQEGKLFKESEFEEILKDYDIITTKSLELNFSYFEGYSKNHNIEDLIQTGIVISEKYPEYYPTFEKIVNSNRTYFGNIMVTSKELFDEYAEWLFTIFFEVQKRIDVSAYDDYHKRVFGFISELLLMVWISTKKLKAYECVVGMVGEKYETKEMKEMLAKYFLNNDCNGAKSYFIEFRNKRPDVLMEASDTTGELKLAMQVIATSDIENQTYHKSILDEINDFDKLMIHFNQLNNIVNRYGLKNQLADDIIFLQDKKISHLAIEIAVKLLCPDPQSAVNTLLKIASEMSKVSNDTMALQLQKRSLDYNISTKQISSDVLYFTSI